MYTMTGDSVTLQREIWGASSRFENTLDSNANKKNSDLSCDLTIKKKMTSGKIICNIVTERLSFKIGQNFQDFRSFPYY